MLTPPGLDPADLGAFCHTARRARERHGLNLDLPGYLRLCRAAHSPRLSRLVGAAGGGRERRMVAFERRCLVVVVASGLVVTVLSPEGTDA